MPGKPPSAGQKVTLGADAPVTQESAGAVAPDSLAAESSAFSSSNRSDGPGEVPHSSGGATASRRSRHGGSDEPVSQPDSSYSYDSSTQQGGPAPTYVNNQYYRDPKGPHGKNLTEGFDDGRPGDSLSAEPGSEDDPGRVAEETFRRRNEGGGDGGGGRPAGLGGAEVEPQTYGALESETSA